MKVEIKIDPACSEAVFTIRTAEMTAEIVELVRSLESGKEERARFLIGFRDDEAELLNPREILRVYARDNSCAAVTDRGVLHLKLRLYEVEERLNERQFVRISKSEIVNLDRVLGFDFSSSGTIGIRMDDRSRTYVARRYVSKIKSVLGMGGK